jgi:putative two-component system response regulator
MTKGASGEPNGARARPMTPRFQPGEMPSLFGDTAAALIVDDDQQAARALSWLLADEGYRCTLAANATEARARLSEGPFALALVDVMMPGESGLELAARMLADFPDLAVVMVTAVDDPTIAELALETGAYGYIVKPFSANDVLITVANAGRRRCLEIERDAYEHRLELLIGEQEADLDDALRQLKDERRRMATGPSS